LSRRIHRENLEPIAEIQTSRLGGFAPRQLQNIVDDGAHSLRIIANDVGETAFVGSDVGTFREQLSRVTHAPTGLRISCAMLADSLPNAASLPCCTRSAIKWCLHEYQRWAGAVPPSGAKCG